MLPVRDRIALYANIPAIEALDALRHAQKNGAGAGVVEKLALEAFGDPSIARKIAARVAERDLRAGKKVDW